jgi:hypothetical protein
MMAVPGMPGAGAGLMVPAGVDGAGAEDQRNFLRAMPTPVAVINRLF